MESTSQRAAKRDHNAGKLRRPSPSATTTAPLQPHPSIRLSLFPNVPPYVRFSYTRLKPMPAAVRRSLLWRHSSITPSVVRRIVASVGYQLLEPEESAAPTVGGGCAGGSCSSASAAAAATWSGTWANQTKASLYRKLQPSQKFNHLPGTVEVGRKDYLWKNIQRMMRKHGAAAFELMPATYVLPQERSAFHVEWERRRGDGSGAGAGGGAGAGTGGGRLHRYRRPPDQCWIIKPPAGYRGNGVRLVRKYKQVPYCVPVVAQRYVLHPYLINGAKFDLRLYVLVTSANPLRVYWYEDGLVRFATTAYSTDARTYGDRYVHLTNYSVNRTNVDYVTNADADACAGHKWTVRTLWRYLERERQVDVARLRQRLVDLVVKTVISGENAIAKSAAEHLQSRYNAFELFGFDVILDSDLKPWLLEVNISPSLEVSSPLDKAVKVPLVEEVLNVVGFHLPANGRHTDDQLAAGLGLAPSTRVTFDSRVYSMAVSYTEKHKHCSYAGKTKRAEYLHTILDTLTADDVRQLVTYEDELTQLKSFQKVFPSEQSHKYFRYFEKQRYYNLLLDAWEHKYHGDREKGWAVLRAHCEKGVHLRTARRTAKNS